MPVESVSVTTVAGKVGTMNSELIIFLTGVAAGVIFFIDGWGPTPRSEATKEPPPPDTPPKNTPFWESKRFRGFSILISGGIIAPVLDYVGNHKGELLLSYIAGCLLGGVAAFVICMGLYIFWRISKHFKREFWRKAGGLSYTLMDFIYLGIADNPYIEEKRKHEIDMDKTQNEHELKKLRNELPQRIKPPVSYKEGDAQPALEEGMQDKLSQYEKLLQDKPLQDYIFEDWFYKGIDEYWKGEYEKTITYMKNALEKPVDEGQRVIAYLYLGHSYSQLQLYEKGIDIFNIILNIRQTFSMDSDLLSVVYVEKGVALEKLGRYKEALEVYTKAAALDSKDAEIWFNIGNALSELSQDEESLAAYNEAIKLRPDYSEAWNNKSIILGKLGQNEEAFEASTEAINLKPDLAEAWYNKGVALNNLGQFEDALNAFSGAINIKPDYTEAWYNKGVILGNLGRHIEALKANKEAIKYQPTHVDAWYNIGAGLHKLGRFDEALNAYTETIKYKSDYIFAWYGKACVYALQNDKQHALENLQQAIKLDSTYKEKAKTDEDFKNLWTDPDFLRIVE